MMHRVVRILIYIQLLLLSSFARSIIIPPSLELIPVLEGDPSQIIGFSNIEQDDFNNICFAERKKGVHCYDGADLNEVYGQATIGLLKINIDNRQTALHFANSNELFSYSGGKIDKIDIESSLKLEEGNDYIRYLIPKDGQSYFIATSKKLFEYRNNLISHIYTFRKDDHIYSVYQPDENTLQLASTKGLLTVNLKKFNDQLGHNGVVKSEFEGVFVYHKYKDYVLTERGVFYKEEKISDKSFFKLMKRRNGELLLAGRSGLCQLVNRQIKCKKSQSDVVFNLYEDQFENLWASTNNGLKYEPNKAISYIDSSHGLLSSKVRAVQKNNEFLFIGTSNGVNTLNFETLKFEAINITKGLSILSLLQVEDSLWIATRSNLYIYDMLNNNLSEAIEIGGRTVSMALFSDAVWVATQYNGVNMYSKSGYLVRKNATDFLNNVRKISACGNSLIVGTKENGLLRIDSNNVTQFSTEKENYSVFGCSERQILTNSSDNTLLSFNNALTQRSTIQRAEGTSEFNNLIHHTTHIWGIHENGISKFHNNELIGNYPTESLASIYTNRATINAMLLYAPSTKGLAVIDLRKLTGNKIVPPAFTVGSTTSNGSIVLNPQIDNLALAKKVKIYYKQEHQQNFNRLRWGENVVFHAMPKSNIIQFKTEKLLSNQPIKINVDISEYSDLFPENASFLNLLKSNKFLIFLLMLSAVFTIVGWFLGTNYKAKTPSALGKNRVSDSETKNNDSANEFGILYDENAFHKMQVKIMENGAKLGVPAGRVQKANELLLRRGRFNSPQVLASELGIEVKALSNAIKALFGCGKIKHYIDAYCTYAERELGAVLPNQTPAIGAIE